MAMASWTTSLTEAVGLRLVIKARSRGRRL